MFLAVRDNTMVTIVGSKIKASEAKLLSKPSLSHGMWIYTP